MAAVTDLFSIRTNNYNPILDPIRLNFVDEFPQAPEVTILRQSPPKIPDFKITGDNFESRHINEALFVKMEPKPKQEVKEEVKPDPEVKEEVKPELKLEIIPKDEIKQEDFVESFQCSFFESLNRLLIGGENTRMSLRDY
jgi:hypothetical protein